MTDYRADLAQILISAETSFGAERATTYPSGHFLGITKTFNFPDPEYQWQPIYALSYYTRGNNSRSWPYIFEGLQEFAGTIPEITLITGHPLAFILGNETATNQSTYIEHDIREADTLPSFTLDARLLNTDQDSSLIRRWIGCKIDQARLSCEKQGYLTLNIDKFYAKNLKHNVGAVGATDDERSYYKYDSTLAASDGEPKDFPFSGERDPYLFSEGLIEILDGGTLITPGSGTVTPLARVVSFNLSVDNNLTPKYYENTSGTDENRVPYEIWEGKREYKLVLIADINNHDFYKYLLTQGKYGGERRGLGIRMTFNKRQGILSNNSLEIRIPGDTTNKNWTSTITSINPIAGANTANINLGAFVENASHNITGEKRIRVSMQLNVPSVSFLIKDKWGTYLEPVP